MSELKTTSLSHKDNNTGTPNITMYPDGTTQLPGTVMGGFRNQLINGDFRVWQRGRTTYTTPNSYTADRWIVSGGASIAPSTTAPRRGQDAATLTTTGNGFIEQPIELNGVGFEGPFYNGTTWTLSADLTAVPTQTYVRFRTTGGQVTNEVAVAAIPAAGWIDLGQSAANGYKRYSVSFTVGVNAHSSNTCLSLIMQVPTSGMGISAVQLEPGPVATPFEHRPIGTELALCQRYYQTAALRQELYQFDPGNSTFSATVYLPTTMRAVPTTTLGLTAVSPGYNTFINTSSIWLSGAAAGFPRVNSYTADAEL